MSTHAQPLAHAAHGGSLNRTAARATLHCLTGCAVGEVLGMVIGTALGLGNAWTIGLAVGLAFVFGYSLTMLPLLRAGLVFAVVVPVAFASDSFSIAVMELVDNGVMLAIPGAMDAPLADPLFWGSLAFALAVAYLIAYPVNRHLIARGQGHAIVHRHHSDSGSLDRAPAGSPRRFVLFGLAAMLITVAVTVGGALLVGPSHDRPSPGHVPTAPGPRP